MGNHKVYDALALVPGLFVLILWQCVALGRPVASWPVAVASIPQKVTSWKLLPISGDPESLDEGPNIQ